MTDGKIFESITVPVKYIFLDVVGFTKNRSVEAQTDIINTLNKIVKESAESLKLESESIIYLPTGDGLCISLLNVENQYDIHIRLALLILSKLYDYNSGILNEMRKFEIRIGINANTDNLVNDINGNLNLAGTGINEAQRVMSLADGNQIIVSQMVYVSLKLREKYMRMFRDHEAVIKHDEYLTVYQYIPDKNEFPFLNVDEPKSFSYVLGKELSEPKMKIISALYLAYAFKHKKELHNYLKLGYENKIAVVTLYYEADSEKRKLELNSISVFREKIMGWDGAHFWEKLDKIKSINSIIISELYEFIVRDYLIDYAHLFMETHLPNSDYLIADNSCLTAIEESPHKFILNNLGLSSE